MPIVQLAPPAMKETLASIEGNNPYFFAGLVLFDDVCVEAAPIIQYMKRQKWTRQKIRDYAASKGWTVKVIHEYERRDIDAQGRNRDELKRADADD